MAATLYGFASCDMVRNARRWLDTNGVKHNFFDYRRNALDPKVLDGWFDRAGWETVFNRNATAFKNLPEDCKQDIDEAKARALILEEANLIKRPVLDTGTQLVFGFKADAYAKALGQ